MSKGIAKGTQRAEILQKFSANSPPGSRSQIRAHTHLRALVDIWIVTGADEDNNTNPRYKELLKSAADRLVRRLNKRIGSFNYSNRRIRTHRKILKLANRIHGEGVYCMRETYVRLEVPDFLERLHGYHIGEE